MTKFDTYKNMVDDLTAKNKDQNKKLKTLETTVKSQKTTIEQLENDLASKLVAKPDSKKDVKSAFDIATFKSEIKKMVDNGELVNKKYTDKATNKVRNGLIKKFNLGKQEVKERIQSLQALGMCSKRLKLELLKIVFIIYYIFL